MIGQSTDNWTLRVGAPGGVELRIHILWPLTALVVLLAVKSSLVAPWVLLQPSVGLWALAVLFVSVTLHELARVVTATRVGGHPSSLVLGPIGGLTKLHLPVDPPAHLVTALSGPMTYLVLLVTAGCALALSGDREVLRLALRPVSPDIVAPAITTWVTTLTLIAQLTVWINWCLLLLSFLPVDPCDGAELLRGVLWPIVGRSTAANVTARIAICLSVVLLALAVRLPTSYASGAVPLWFPLSVIAIFLFYGGFQQANSRRYDVGISIDEFDSDDEEWLVHEWVDEDREAVLVEHLQDKQQEALDRKRREREASEDARVDDILLQLRNSSFEQLSEEDRATLKRASRRYRQRRAEGE